MTSLDIWLYYGHSEVDGIEDRRALDETVDHLVEEDMIFEFLIHSG